MKITFAGAFGSLKLTRIRYGQAQFMDSALNPKHKQLTPLSPHESHSFGTKGVLFPVSLGHPI